MLAGGLSNHTLGKLHYIVAFGIAAAGQISHFVKSKR